MSVESIVEQITRERRCKEAWPEVDAVDPIRLLLPSLSTESGEGKQKTRAAQDLLERLIFFAPPGRLVSLVDGLEQHGGHEIASLSERDQALYLRFVVDLGLALASYLPRWNLQNRDRQGGTALDDGQVAQLAERVRVLADELAGSAPDAAAGLLTQCRLAAAARLAAEKAADPGREAQALVGDSLGQYLANARAEFAQSHVRRIAERRPSNPVALAGGARVATEISNDYAAFLQHALYLGASFATTNPPLLELAWLADLERWNGTVDAIIAQNPDADVAELGRLVTLEIVLANMRLLRPIFLLTGGMMGCVCLQVNPGNHGHAHKMIDDALFLFQGLRERLAGGVPNVVFKLPGTKAGLEACRVLTGRGIGVVITVNFGLFQHIPFAEAISEGHAPFSCLVEMNGRLSYPVRDELLAKLDDLAAQGIDEASAREAAAWAGVAVIKRMQKLLADRQFDSRRVKTLVASLRIYHGEHYVGLPSAFPDITEALGAGIISFFPDVRRRFDQQPALALDPLRINAPVPDRALAILAHSEIFKQAYYVADRDWVPEEDSRFRPAYELTLDDEHGVAGWAPVRDTLDGFKQSYDSLLARILERRRLLGV